MRRPDILRRKSLPPDELRLINGNVDLDSLENYEALLAMAETAIENGDPEVALRHYDNAMLLSGDDVIGQARVLYKRAGVLAELQRNTEAVDDLRESLSRVYTMEESVERDMFESIILARLEINETALGVNEQL